jgi:hypothetical protein
MLNTIPKAPELGQASRRAVKAAALTIELAGGLPDACTVSSGSQSPTCIHHRGWNLLLLPTTCEGPIYITEAIELVRRLTDESALVVRLDTALEPPISLVTFDAVVRQQGDVVILRGLLPCIVPGDRRLALIPKGASKPVLVFGSMGLAADYAISAADTWNAQDGIAAAAAFFRSRIWGGL